MCYLPTNTCKDQLIFSLSDKGSCSKVIMVMRTMTMMVLMRTMIRMVMIMVVVLVEMHGYVKCSWPSIATISSFKATHFKLRWTYILCFFFRPQIAMTMKFVIWRPRYTPPPSSGSLQLFVYLCIWYFSGIWVFVIILSWAELVFWAICALGYMYIWSFSEMKLLVMKIYQRS